MVTVTPKAAETIKAIVSEDKREEPIRIFFAGYSCSGPAYMMGFDKKKDDDVELKVDGFKLIYDKELEADLKEATIDSVDTPQGPGVVVRVKPSKPSGASSCGGSCSGCH
jgi:Fe-S cluster assembly iron-binding protein IscA